MRKSMKFLHVLGACGMIGALVTWFILLAVAPQETPQAYADLRASIAALGNYLLVPAMGTTLVSGVMSIAIHHPFQNLKWVWVKALLGIPVFEGTLSLIGAKADRANAMAQRMLEGEVSRDAIERAVASEWQHLGLILALSVVNVLIGVWRPSFARKATKEAKAAKCNGIDAGAAPASVLFATEPEDDNGRRPTFPSFLC